ncbi:hypothetical protein KKB10_04160 [Patescibacteria group bacterium]|nr:hypothetical protein [Patescibacteria group bacterium]MBU1074997.1 hypothetical protein [Patescibacteria group bacterium]MBU1952494.1 hypothetical protein [Patescibacteria group bacterium]
MPVNPDSKLLVRAADLIKGAPLDADLRLLLIEMIVRIDDDKLEEVLTQIEQFTKSSEEDTEKLRTALQELKENYAKKREGLEDQTELELQELEKEIGDEEETEKIKQVQKKIQDS